MNKSFAKPPLPPPPNTPLSKRLPAKGPGKKPRLNWWKKGLIAVFLAVIAAGGIFGYKILAAGNKISAADQSLLGQLRDLFFSSKESLKGEKDGRINVLIIAIGGDGHDGADLADSVMVASIRPETGDVALLSIPRDLWVQMPGEQYYTKINSVHAYGEIRRKKQGPEVLTEKVEDITGLPIHYYIRTDFAAFKGIVDAVGGVNVTIENSFYDYWHKISFPAGTEKMNGERALAYVRARYVEGSEGGDFRRAARQQQVLLAMKSKVFSVNTALDFRAINSILDSLSNNIRTNMQIWEMKRFFELARLLKSDEAKSVVLTTGHNGVLVGGTEMLNGVPASVLKPRTGDYSEIRHIAEHIFSDEVGSVLAHETSSSGSSAAASTPAPTATPRPTPQQAATKPTLEIRNGTNTAGLAQKTADNMKGKGYNVLAIGNASNPNTAKTTVYALHSGAASGAKTVADLLKASVGSALPSGELKSTAEVLIILGQDAN